MSDSEQQSSVFTVSSEPGAVPANVPLDVLLKQVYHTHKAITEGLQEQVNHLTELLLQKEQQASGPCQRCCVIRRAFEKYKGNHHRLVSRQEAKIRMLEARLSLAQTTSGTRSNGADDSGSPGNEDAAARDGTIADRSRPVAESDAALPRSRSGETEGIPRDAGNRSDDASPTRSRREGTGRPLTPSPVAEGEHYGSPSLIGRVGVLDHARTDAATAHTGCVPSLPSPNASPGPTGVAKKKKTPSAAPKRKAAPKASISEPERQRKLWDGRCFLSVDRHTPCSSRGKRIRKMDHGSGGRSDGESRSEEAGRRARAASFKYCHSPVRKKAARRQLPAHDCKECRDFYRGAELPTASCNELMRKWSRHRAAHAPPPTPEHFWEMDFPDTQECRRRGYVKPTQGAQRVDECSFERE